MSEESNEALEAIKEEIKTNVLGRFSSPFSGAFLISWLAWNHRMVFVLLSDLKVVERFHYIDESIYPTAKAFLLLNFGRPLLSTLAYIFVLPWPTEWVHKWNLRRKLRLYYAELESKNTSLLSGPESARLRQDVAELRAKLSQKRIDLANLKRQTTALRMTSTAGLNDHENGPTHSAYLCSQLFILEAGQANHVSSPWRFSDDGNVTPKEYKGNLRWKYHQGRIHFLDVDQDPGDLGSLSFSQSSNKFEGKLTGFGHVRLRGAHHSSDFGAIF